MNITGYMVCNRKTINIICYVYIIWPACRAKNLREILLLLLYVYLLCLLYCVWVWKKRGKILFIFPYFRLYIYYNLWYNRMNYYSWLYYYFINGKYYVYKISFTLICWIRNIFFFFMQIMIYGKIN